MYIRTCFVCIDTGAENDLETVKKGTPLYGQPSWWGEGEDGGETDTPPLPDGQQKLARQQQDTHYQGKADLHVRASHPYLKRVQVLVT